MFGERLKNLRENYGLTQLELSEKINITRSSLSLYELGKRNPDFNTLNVIADLFDVSVD